MAIEPGKTYKGSGTINEFGEVTFRFYGHSERERDPYKMITGKGDGECDYTIDHNTRTLRVHVSVPYCKFKRSVREELLRNLFCMALAKLNDYDI